MREFIKDKLSASTDGKAVAVSATTSGAAVIVHTAVSGVADWDEVWLYASNITAADVTLTIMFGGATTADTTNVVIPAYSGRTPIIVGEVLRNAAVVKAYASVANAINIGGYINKIVTVV